MIYVEKYDKNYDESLFITKVDHIFIMILSSIMDNDMTKVKHYLSDEIYQKFDKLVESYKEKKVIRLFDEMNVKSTEINDTSFKDNNIIIEVTITSRYMDYFVNEDGEFISGNNQHRIEKRHHITFTKNTNTKELNEARRCPSCGNTMDINKTGECPYCHQIIEMKEYDYIITEMELI